MTCGENCLCDHQKCRNMDTLTEVWLWSCFSRFSADVCAGFETKPLVSPTVGSEPDRKCFQRLSVPAGPHVQQPWKQHLLQASILHPHQEGKPHTGQEGPRSLFWFLLEEDILQTLFLGAEGVWGQGPQHCRPEADPETHHGRRGGGGGGQRGWRRRQRQNNGQLPQEEEEDPNQLPKQFFLWLYSD